MIRVLVDYIIGKLGRWIERMAVDVRVADGAFNAGYSAKPMATTATG